MEGDINVDGTTLNSVQEFTYIGSIIARYGHIEAELQKRMPKASISFGRLRERLWNNHNVSIRVKGEIYRAILLSALLFGAETWKVYSVPESYKEATHFHDETSAVKWKHQVIKIKVLKRAGLPSMEDLLIRKNIRWTELFLRIPTDRLPRLVLYSQLPEGQRPRGFPGLPYKDTIKINLKKRDIDTKLWKSLPL